MSLKIFLTASQSCPPDNLQFPTFFRDCQSLAAGAKAKFPDLSGTDPSRLLTAVALRLTLTGPAASFPVSAPNPKESPFQLGPVHKGRGADCNGGMMDQCVGTRSQNKQLCCREDHLSTRIALDQAALGAGLGGGCNI